MGAFLADLRYAARAVRRQRGLAATAILTLALGIGGSSTIFTLYRAVLARSMPVSHPDSLYFLYRYNTGRGYYSSVSWPDFVDYQERSRGLLTLAAYWATPVGLGGDGATTDRVDAVLATSNYFDVLGIAASRGRVFDTPQNDEPVAVISHTLWTTRFASDPAIVGRAVKINGHPLTVVGVAPPGFAGLDVGSPAAIWIPLAALPATRERFTLRGMDWLEVMGRLAPDVGLPRASELVASLARQLSTADHPDAAAGWTATLEPGNRGNLYPPARARLSRILTLFAASAALVLVIACANVANLLLARAAARRRELLIRAALGAGRTRIIRQVVAESLLLSLGGAFVGTVLALWTRDAIGSFTLAGEIPIGALSLQLDWQVVTFTFLLAAVSALAVGLVAAWPASRIDLQTELRRASPGQGLRTSNLRRALVVLQVAMSLMLLVATGLFLRSLNGQLDLDPGFRSQNTLIVSVNLSDGARDASDGQRLYASIADRVAGLPRVESAAWTSVVPFGIMRMRRSVFAVGSIIAQTDLVPVDANVVGPDYFKTLGVTIVRGRAFSAHDSANAPRVVIVNESFAKRHWPGQDPIGRTLRTAPDGPPWTVIGVAEDTRYYDLRTLRGPQRPYIYFALAQSDQPSMTLLVRSSSAPAAIAAAVRESVGAQDPDLSVTLTTAKAHVDRALSQEWMATTLTAVFGAVALLLAVIGLHGVIAYEASQRVHEIGVRMALGARRTHIMTLVLRESATLAGFGVIAGLTGALISTRLLTTLLHDVDARDPVTFGGTVALTAIVALAAGFLPARRAAFVDPLIALRED